jgi:hypothetical protein
LIYDDFGGFNFNVRSKTMTQEIRDVLLRVPGTEIQAHPVRIFPGATIEDLFRVLNEDPEFPKDKADQTKYQVMRVLGNGKLQLIEQREDMYPLLKNGAVLEIWSNRAPVLGLQLS